MTTPSPSNAATAWNAPAVPVPSIPPAVRTQSVLHLINGEHYSGAERVQDLLARTMPEFGYNVGFACLKPGKFPDSRDCQDASLYETPMRFKLDIGVARRIAHIVQLDGFGAIHAHTPRTLMLGAMAKRLVQCPLIYHVHSPTSRDSTRPIQNWLNDKIEFTSLRCVDKIITVSHSLAQYLASRGIDSDRIAVVPNGVPFCTNQRSDKRPTDTWTLGSVALFRPRKGMETLIRAVAALRKSGENVRILAVGPFETESYEHQLKQLVNECGMDDAIEWTGFTRDVNTELRKMDLFAIPSLFGEGLPMVVLEAMAAGLPVVGTLVEGIPEAVRDGFDGTLAEPNSPEAFAMAVRRIMFELDWQELRRNAITRHAEHFSDRAMARGVADVYSTLTFG